MCLICSQNAEKSTRKMNAKKYLLSWASHYLGVVHISISILALSIAFIVPLCVSRIFLTNSFIDLSIFLGSKQLTFYLFAVSFICHNSQVLVYVNDKAPTLLTLSLLREVRIRARFDCLRGGTWSELKTTQGDSHLLSCTLCISSSDVFANWLWTFFSFWLHSG